MFLLSSSVTLGLYDTYALRYFLNFGSKDFLASSFAVILAAVLVSGLIATGYLAIKSLYEVSRSGVTTSKDNFHRPMFAGEVAYG
jgi:hypothetical protein